MTAPVNGSAVERTHASLSAQAEDLLRLLAAAVAVVRLYPVTSPIRGEAISRFRSGANDITAATGPLQYYIDRTRFIISNTRIGEAFPQVSALAEAMHALQVGQMIIAPGLTDNEVAGFLEVITRDSIAVREGGGARAAILEAGVANIALIEVTLRASSEEGLLGLDLTTAPLEEIAAGMQAAAERWEDGDHAEDQLAEAIDRLEPAARDLAMRRCAEALMLLDEATRMQMMAAALPDALTPDAKAMEGLLPVIAHMPPAALARLLQLTAGMQGDTPEGVLGSLELPPELASEIASLLRPSAQTDEQRGIPPEADVSGIAEEVAAADEEDMLHLDVLVKATTGRAAAARGLITTLRMAKDRPSADTIASVAEAVVPAIREGALPEIVAVSEFLQRLADDPQLAGPVRAAQTALNQPPLLEACARQLAEDPSAETASMLLTNAGTAGAEAVLGIYLGAGELQRANLLPTVGAMIESVAPVASRVLRSGDSASASAVLRLLGSVGSRRLAATIAAGLEHLDARVREAAVVALADSPGPESSQLLLKALAHWDPETRRIAAREIGRTKNEDLVPGLLKIVGEVSLFERNYELKKEVLKSLEALKSPRAVPVLRRIAHQRLTIGKRNRELRYLARRVLESLE